MTQTRRLLRSTRLGSTSTSVDDCIINGAALVKMNNPRMSKTFGEYCGIEISEIVAKIANTVERVDIVFDTYRKVSRKRKTREG